MLLKIWKEGDWRKMIAVGQFAMIAGWIFLLLALLLHQGGTLPPVLARLASPNYWKGFCIGLGTTVMLLSVLMNVKGLIYYRKYRRI
ncbi:MAG: hypothetical protein GXO70_03960 [Acidobacteria bacterium]|nr:hypothetical protein [Acidobacteriota bacterium]